MKLPGFFNAKALIVALLCMHAVPLVFTLYTETLLNTILPALIVVGLPLVVWLAYTHARTRWQPLVAERRPFKYILSLIATFISLFLMLATVAHFSLFTQPVMFNEAGDPYLITLPGAELGAYAWRLCLQTWVLAVGAALVMNQVKTSKKTGLLLGRFKTLAAYAWLIDLFVMAGMLIAAFSLLSFAVIQLEQLLANALGLDEIIFAQNNLFVMVFVMYLLNLSMKFSVRLRDYAKHENSTVASIVLLQAGFLIVCWGLSKLAIVFLPEAYQEELVSPIYIPGIEFDKFTQHWQLFVLAWSFFVVPPLAAYLARLSAKQTVRASTFFLLGIPLVATLLVAMFIPGLSSGLSTWAMDLHFYTTALDNITARFHPSLGVIACLTAAGALVWAFRRNSLLPQSMVAVMPDNFGRRMLRMNLVFARFTAYFYVIFIMTLVLGVFGLGIFAAAYMLTVVLGIVLLLIHGVWTSFKQQPQLSVKPMERVNT